MPIPRFLPDRTALLVVDLQEKLLPLIEGAAGVERQCSKLIRGLGALGVPMVVTEQYPRGLGRTAPPIASVLPGGAPVESKVKFSALVEGVRRRLQEWGSTHVVVCGVETHVCVTQTVLDLMEAGFVAGVAVDAVGSRAVSDHSAALRRLEQAAAVPLTVETILFEMVHEAGTDRFKAVLPIVKG